MALSSILLWFLAAHQAGQSASKGSDFAQAWSSVESAIRGRYFARQSRKDEMEALLAKYAPSAKAAKAEAEFSLAVNRMIDDFKDSHFDFFTKEDQGYYAMDGLIRQRNAAEMPHIGAWFRKDPDGYTVQMVLNGTQAEKSDLRKGDLVLAVNGRPFSPISSLGELVGKRAKLKVRRGAAELEKEVEVAKSAVPTLFLDATRDSARIIERDGKKLAYVHLWTMAGEEFRNALHGLVYGRFRDTDGFLLDIRDGFGGRPEGFGDPFFRPETSLEWKFGETAGSKQLFGYQRPLVLIVNEGSRSAKEVFSHIMKRSKRAVLVGSTTAGHVLGTFPQRIGDWAYLEIPMVDVIADGVRLEGKGVAPDIAVPREFDANGKDLFLERAIEVLLGEIAARNHRAA